MASVTPALAAAYTDDSRTIDSILDEFPHMSWDQVQRGRKKYRDLHGLPPIKQGRRDKVNDAPRYYDHRSAAREEHVTVHKLDDEQFERLATIGDGIIEVIRELVNHVRR